MRSLKVMHSKGYRLVYRPEHPYANSDGYVPDHRLVMEQSIGRFINPSVEDVHHCDENLETNTLDNLVLLTKEAHRRIHAGWKLIEGVWWKTCQHCGKFMPVEANFYRRRQGHNQFVSTCKHCCRLITADKRPPKLRREERSIIASRGAFKGWLTKKLGAMEC